MYCIHKCIFTSMSSDIVQLRVLRTISARLSIIQIKARVDKPWQGGGVAGLMRASSISMGGAPVAPWGLHYVFLIGCWLVHESSTGATYMGGLAPWGLHGVDGVVVECHVGQCPNSISVCMAMCGQKIVCCMATYAWALCPRSHCHDSGIA